MPDNYVGLYESGQYGYLNVTNETVDTEQLLLPICVIGGATVISEVIRWNPVKFTYDKSGAFEFDAYVESTISSVKGNAHFSGSFSENIATYDINFYYHENNRILFAKAK